MAEQASKNRDSLLKKKYKKKGIRQLTYAEYMANKKKAERKKISMPAHIKIILATPFLIVFSFGIFFLPYMLYTIATSPPSLENINSTEVKKNIPNALNR